MSKRIARPAMVIRKGGAESRGYCVREFDRNKFKADAAQDISRMSQEQKKVDIHFTGVTYDARYPVVWCGFTSLKNDLLWTFDPKSKRFESKGFPAVAEEHEIKIHRGMQVGPDGCIYFGTAGLVSIEQHSTAPGGRLFRYDPRTGAYECLGRPVEHDYVQTIDVDYRRGIVYGATYPSPYFFGWDIASRKRLFCVYLGDWPHQVRVDDDGKCWATFIPKPWTPNFHRLMNYDPSSKKLNWTEVALPGESHLTDTSIDSFAKGDDGFLYIGASSGALFRLDPKKGKVELVLKPAISAGFGALSPPANGKIYGIAGTYATTEVFSYDLRKNEVVLHGPAHDQQRNTTICRPHELVLGPGRRLYCPETDNFERQCYFWEIQLKG